jgi:Uma2 family endonuclease
VGFFRGRRRAIIRYGLASAADRQCGILPGFDEANSDKHEYVDGYMVALAGSSPEHSSITANIAIAVGGRLNRSKCRPYSSDIRITTDALTTWLYPDFLVVCGTPEYLDTRPKTLLNPTFLVEVLSPSTTVYDRTLKAPRYKACASVREFLLVEQHPAHVEHWKRSSVGEWELETVTGPDAVLKLESVAIEVPLREFYIGLE